MRVRTSFVGALALAGGLVASTGIVGGQSATITIDAGTTYQTMRGWEVVTYADQLNAAFPTWQDAALDAAVDAGIDRVRLEVRSGSEHSADTFAQWVSAGQPDSGPAYQTWRARRYETINDNADPNVINAAGFHWTDVDHAVNTIVNPMRRRLALRGEQLYVHFDYVAFLSQVTSGVPYVHQNPNEYAEFMVAAFQHLQSTYGWTPDGLSIILEPDNTSPPWSGAFIGQVIAATVPRLAAAGFAPDIIAPATTCMSNAVPYYDALAAVPAARAAVKEIAYHRYCGVSQAALQGIAARAAATGTATAMLEWWTPANTHETLHEDLKIGMNGAWEQGAIADRAGSTTAAVSYLTDTNQVLLAHHTKFFRQYYQHVRRGAVRLRATTTDARFDPLVFRNADGRHAVVVKANGGGTFSIAGLPAGLYGVTYTASTAGNADIPNQEGALPDRTIAAGQLLSVTMPAWGVATVFARSNTPTGPVIAPPTGVVVDSIAADRVNLRWVPPASTANLTGFQLEGGFSPGAVAGALPLGLVTGASLSLPPGTYYLRVRSVAGSTASAPSADVVVRVGAAVPPSAPTTLEGLVVGSSLHLVWHNTWTGGTPTAALLDVEGPVQATVPLGLVETFTAPQVPPGTYTLRVRNTNAAGPSPPSNAVTVSVPSSCSGAPRPITALTAYALGGRLSIAWDYGAGGPAATSYVLTASGPVGGSVAVPVRTLDAVVPPGTYALRVTASNACGTSAASAPVTVTVP